MNINLCAINVSQSNKEDFSCYQLNAKNVPFYHHPEKRTVIKNVCLVTKKCDWSLCYKLVEVAK